ncbi:MAG: hypothetical protein AAF990_23225 [Bacteroidota bacterium]
MNSIKNHFSKNPYSFYLTLLMLLTLSSSALAQRNTIWMMGLSPTSDSWGPTQNQFALDGYQFNDLINSTYLPATGINSAVGQVENLINNQSNILGIAHDYGGIVLRELQLQNPNISAMILDGVPNQGSVGISLLIDDQGVGFETSAEQLVDAIQNIKSGDECKDCQVVEAFERWIKDVKKGKSAYEEVLPNSPRIQNLDPPTVPFAILWGNQKDVAVSLPSFLSSIGFPASQTDEYTTCYRGALARARQEAKDKFTISTIRNTSGLFKNIFSAVGSIIKDPKTGNVFKEIGNFIDNTVKSITDRITAIREKDRELARILRCEMANQLLATEWELLLIENTAIEEEEFVIPDEALHRACIDDCEERNYYDGYNTDCNDFCDGILGMTYTKTLYKTQPNDGVLLRDEQLLDGASAVYELVNTNHLQEVDLNLPPVKEAFTDLFNGNAGAAFSLQ